MVKTAKHRPGAILAKAAAVIEKDYSDHVMIALAPPESAVQPLYDLDVATEDQSEAHLTLYYLGTVDEAGDQQRLIAAVQDFVVGSHRSMPLTGKVNGFGTFANDDENVLWAAWDIPHIAEFRGSLVDYLEDNGVPLREENHGFTPHMTLGYSDEPITTLPRLPEGLPEVTFSSIAVVWGTDWTHVAL